jgi:hypothetical protein
MKHDKLPLIWPPEKEPAVWAAAVAFALGVVIVVVAVLMGK